MNLLKFSYSSTIKKNIIHRGVYGRKKQNKQTKTTTNQEPFCLLQLVGEHKNPEARKKGWKHWSCWMGQHKWRGEGAPQQWKNFCSRPQMKLHFIVMQFHNCFHLLVLSLNSWSAFVPLEFSLRLQVKCRSWSAFLSISNRRADP